MRAAVVALLVALPCQTKIVALPTRGSTGGEHSAVGHQHAVIAKRRVTGQRGRSKDVAGGPGRCAAPLALHLSFPLEATPASRMVQYGIVPAFDEGLGSARAAADAPNQLLSTPACAAEFKKRVARIVRRSQEML